MYPEKPLVTKVIMSVLTSILTSACVLGNGFLLAIIARFKLLQTVPNILIANLALVDLLNAVINFPMYLMFSVLEADWFRGKALGIITSISDRVFGMLNLLSMLALLTNMYLAISFGLKNLAWKTKKNALICASLVWVISIVSTALFSIPLFDIDLGDAHVIEYRDEIFKQGKVFVMGVRAFFVVCTTIVSFLTTRAIGKKIKKREEMNLSTTQAEARLKQDVKATKTIAITIATYLACHIPIVVFAMIGLQNASQAQNWFAFIVWYSINISSAVNPIIYYTRLSRCRSAFKQFLKDPCGSTDYNEMPHSHSNAQDIARKNDKERDGDGNALEVQSDGNSMRPKHSSNRRNAIVLAGLPLNESLESEVGDVASENPGGKELSGEALSLKGRVQNLPEGSKEETEGGNKEVPEKISWEKKSKKRKPTSSKVHPLEVIAMSKTRKPGGEQKDESSYSATGSSSKEDLETRQPHSSKVHPLEATEMSKTGHRAPDGEKQDVGRYYSGRKAIRKGFSWKRSNTIANAQELQNFRVTAWIGKEEQGIETLETT